MPRNQDSDVAENLLGAHLQGLTLRQWVEKTTCEAVAATEQTTPPIDLSPIQMARRIKEVSYCASLPEWGSLRVDRDGFVVKLARLRATAALWSRWTLAHEIAHTFLYDITQSPPRSLVYVGSGNPKLEWLCRCLSRSLLMPEGWVAHMLANGANSPTPTITLHVLDEMERRFGVPWTIVAERIVEDLGLWRCILLQFVAEASGNDLLVEAGHRREWRLCWSTASASSSGQLYLPRGRREQTGMRFPRAKGQVRMLVEDIMRTESVGSSFTRAINLSQLAGPTVGNLGTYLANQIGADTINAVGLLKIGERRRLSGGYSEGPSLVLAFPLT